MKKRIWISALGKDEARSSDVMGALHKYGMEPAGHFWEDQVEKLAWMGALERIVADDAKAWVVLLDAAAWEKESVRYGVAMLALSIKSARGAAFPIFLLLPDGMALDAATMATPLAGAVVMPQKGAWLAKLAAKTAVAPKMGSGDDFRLDAYGDGKVGQWFEVGPAHGTWKGVLFAVAGGGEILFQAVGPKDKLPEKTTLEYAQKGLKMTLGDTEFTGWAVQNVINETTSCFVKVGGAPTSILFAPYDPEGEEADVYRVRLV
ncbi:MAG: hypothetical protein HQK87_09775 [Nitrospinae bacterium]|nr:hypothetical protein [Nitrospinota bacterium]